MSRIGDLENKILVLESKIKGPEDERAIREVLSRYGYNADNGRGQAYVDLYMEHGIVNLSTIVAGKPGDLTHHGKEELMKFITDPTGHKTIEGRCMHIMDSRTCGPYQRR